MTPGVRYIISLQRAISSYAVEDLRTRAMIASNLVSTQIVEIPKSRLKNT